MLKLPLVTFIVTSFNYAKYITKTLESIKAQTYKNFEIIVVDDCSSDNSVQKVEDFISENQDLRITLIKQEENKGQLASMLRGLKEAKGQFVSFIDSDDILFPEYTSAHIKVHLQTSVAFTSCQVAEIGENDEIHTLKSISSPQKTSKKSYIEDNIKDIDQISDINITYKKLDKKRFGGWYWSPNSSAMFRKASIEILLEYKNANKWKICPDKFIFNFANLIGGSVIIYEPLIAYRRHKNNAGDCSFVTGDKKLHSDYITKVALGNNIKIFPETIKFLWDVKNKLGNRNAIELILKIILSNFCI